MSRTRTLSIGDLKITYVPSIKELVVETVNGDNEAVFREDDLEDLHFLIHALSMTANEMTPWDEYDQ